MREEFDDLKVDEMARQLSPFRQLPGLRLAQEIRRQQKVFVGEASSRLRRNSKLSGQ
jgi:hypothetical protein